MKILCDLRCLPCLTAMVLLLSVRLSAVAVDLHYQGAVPGSGRGAYGVAISGELAYVGAGHGGFRVFDLRKETNAKIGECQTLGYATDVTVAGNYAYVSSGQRFNSPEGTYTGGGLEVIDISDPTHPQRIGGETNCIPGPVVISGDHAYLTTGSCWDGSNYVARSGFQVMDIKDPRHPVRVANLNTSPSGRLAIAGSFVYIADGQAGLEILDISDPASPKRVGNYHGTRDVLDVAIQGNYAYLAEGSLWIGGNFAAPGGLQILDISDPTHPRPVAASYPDEALYANSISIDGDYAVLFSVGLIDIRDPANPRFVAALRSPNDDLYKAVISGPFIYVPDYAAGLHVFKIQTTVELTSVSATAQGAKLVWTDPEPGRAYTVQVSDSLSSGIWRNARTRYRWPWPFTRWGDAPVNLPAARFYRVLAEPIATPNRGRLLSSYVRNQNSKGGLQDSFARWGVSGFAQPKFATVALPFTYETVDPYGLSITNSALLILPTGVGAPLPLLSVQHPTLVLKSDAPSQPGSGDIWAAVLASYGYAVVAADYLGLGSSPGYQAFVHARSEATCVVDALRAGKALCASSNVTLNGQLFLTGYSQGGHVTMAAHRELELSHPDLPVTAAAPCAGPYDIGGATVDALLTNRVHPYPFLFGMIVASYLPIYQLGDTLEDLLAEPYRRKLPPLLDGMHDSAQLAAVMPSDMFAILRGDFQADFRTNVNNPLRLALRDNNTYDWKPQAPLKMFHCQADDVNIFANAEIAYQSFTNRAACCVTLVDPGAPARLNHDDCYLPSLKGVLTWFETLRR